MLAMVIIYNNLSSQTIHQSLSCQNTKCIFCFYLYIGPVSSVYIVHLKSNPLLLELLFVLRITIISGNTYFKMPTRILHNFQFTVEICPEDSVSVSASTVRAAVKEGDWDVGRSLLCPALSVFTFIILMEPS